MFAESTTTHTVMKGDLLDLDFSMDMDHRKRRRNRTTQSCLNCHTSKRKCDRKRPCQRCIQLGLTGLCVYEVDDPALRDDPDIDETTRLRNRIAELESLVRELRGKPHPRWADPNYYDGDASDKWHTRSQKRNLNGTTNGVSSTKSPTSFQQQRRPGEISVKTEPVNDLHAHQQAQQQQCYYRLSPSSPALGSAQYGITNGTNGNSTGGHFSFDGSTADGSPTSYSPSSPAGYSGSSSSSVLNGAGAGNGAYRYPSSSDRKGYTQSPHDTHLNHSHQQRDAYRGYEETCSCVTNPIAENTLLTFSRQLDTVVGCMNHLPEHIHSHTQKCGLMRRIQELKVLLHGDQTYPKSTSPPFSSSNGFDASNGGSASTTASANGSTGSTGGGDTLRSPVDSDLMTPLSITSSVPLSTPTTPHTLQTMHWDAPAQNGGYNPYFQGVGDVYSKAVATYDVVS